MEKYIKANTILKFINGCLEHEDKITDIEKAVLTGVKTCVERIPAADVVEIRHGYWIKQSPDFDLCGVAYYQCSECGKEQQTSSNYCQFCGAKMDGE